jgi:hypothetical protein
LIGVAAHPGRFRRLGIAVVLALAIVVALLSVRTSSAVAGKTFQIGYGDPELASESASTRNLWSERAVESGASVTRIIVAWAEIAPKSPAGGFDATNPGSSGYSWGNLDAAVRTASAHGLKVLLSVQHAPKWAEGPGRPSDIELGAWEPDPVAYGEFAQALAKRYSGSYPDPLTPGSSLPRVRYFAAWNEPNLENFLAPQDKGGKLVGPSLYRKLLNSFYAGVKTAQPGAKVLGANSASFGAPNGFSTAPVLFLRDLLCLKGAALKPTSCPEKAHFDILSAHAIQVGPPTESAISPLDATTPDMGRLTAVVRAAEKAKTVVSSGHIPLWVTEFWVDTKPPDPGGISLAKQARWYQQNMYEYWKAGAEVAIELLLRDQDPGSIGYPETIQSGVYFLNGQPKPSHLAMRFPLVAHHAGHKVAIWGIAPVAGTVQIQAFRGGAWKTLAKVHAGGRGRPFTTSFTLPGGAKLRARIGGELSLPWALG